MLTGPHRGIAVPALFSAAYDRPPAGVLSRHAALAGEDDELAVADVAGERVPLASGVKRRTGSSASRLSLTPILPPDTAATSTQLPLVKLSELFIQWGPLACCPSGPSTPGLQRGEFLPGLGELPLKCLDSGLVLGTLRGCRLRPTVSGAVMDGLRVFQRPLPSWSAK